MSEFFKCLSFKQFTSGDGLGLDANDLSTQALITTSHALVGGTIAELTGGEFSSGAIYGYPVSHKNRV